MYPTQVIFFQKKLQMALGRSDQTLPHSSKVRTVRRTPLPFNAFEEKRVLNLFIIPRLDGILDFLVSTLEVRAIV